MRAIEKERFLYFRAAVGRTSTAPPPTAENADEFLPGAPTHGHAQGGMPTSLADGPTSAHFS